MAAPSSAFRSSKIFTIFNGQQVQNSLAIQTVDKEIIKQRFFLDELTTVKDGDGNDGFTGMCYEGSDNYKQHAPQHIGSIKMHLSGSNATNFVDAGLNTFGKVFISAIEANAVNYIQIVIGVVQPYYSFVEYLEIEINDYGYVIDQNFPIVHSDPQREAIFAPAFDVSRIKYFRITLPSQLDVDTLYTNSAEVKFKLGDEFGNRGQVASSTIPITAPVSVLVTYKRQNSNSPCDKDNEAYTLLFTKITRTKILPEMPVSQFEVYREPDGQWVWMAEDTFNSNTLFFKDAACTQLADDGIYTGYWAQYAVRLTDGRVGLERYECLPPVILPPRDMDRFNIVRNSVDQNGVNITVTGSVYRQNDGTDMGGVTVNCRVSDYVGSTNFSVYLFPNTFSSDFETTFRLKNPDFDGTVTLEILSLNWD